MSQSRMPPTITAGKVLISLFIVVHVSAICLWLCPSSRIRDLLLAPLRPYVTFLGLWQSWGVFAPDPKNWNPYMTALIIFADGSQKMWEFPRMDKLNLIDKMFKERYRKWANDCVNNEQVAIVWPDTARYIARLHSNPVNPPVSVSIIRHWTWISPPNECPKRRVPEGGGSKTLFTYDLAPEDLK